MLRRISFPLCAGLALLGLPVLVFAAPVVRPYEIYDARFCELTPRPFLCGACLKKGEQFVQILKFEDDGRPVRTYACRPWEIKYLK